MNDHINTAKKFYEVFSTGEVAVFDEVLATNWQAIPAVPGNPGGRDGQKGTVGYLRAVLSDLTYSVEEIYECGPDLVACRCVLRGVQHGPFLGLSATGAAIELATMEFHYFKDGQIVATRHLEDFFGVYQQLLSAGATPLAANA